MSLTRNRVVQDEADEAAHEHAGGQQHHDDLVEGLDPRVDALRVGLEKVKQC